MKLRALICLIFPIILGGCTIGGVKTVKNADDFLKALKEFDEGDVSWTCIRLKKDIDFENKQYTFEEYYNAVGHAHNNLTIDGENHTIKNLKLINNNPSIRFSPGGYDQIGIIPNYSGHIVSINFENITIENARHAGVITNRLSCPSVVKDVTARNCHLLGYGEENGGWGCYGGSLVGEFNNSNYKYLPKMDVERASKESFISNCKAIDCEVKDFTAAGGLIGYFNEPSYLCENCENINTTVSSSGLVQEAIKQDNTIDVESTASGGIFGVVDIGENYYNGVKGLEINNFKNSGPISSESGNAGGIIGSIDCHNEYLKGTFDYYSTPHTFSPLYITGCTNTGEITSVRPGSGILGYLCNYENTINILRCSNNNKIRCYRGAGILGETKAQAVLTNCNNELNSIIDNGYGGLIGDCPQAKLTSCNNKGKNINCAGLAYTCQSLVGCEFSGVLDNTYQTNRVFGLIERIEDVGFDGRNNKLTATINANGGDVCLFGGYFKNKYLSTFKENSFNCSVNNANQIFSMFCTFTFTTVYNKVLDFEFNTLSSIVKMNNIASCYAIESLKYNSEETVGKSIRFIYPSNVRFYDLENNDIQITFVRETTQDDLLYSFVPMV